MHLSEKVVEEEKMEHAAVAIADEYAQVKVTEEMDQEMTELFHDFMQYGALGLHIVDRNGIILWANEAELNVMGYSKDEYIGKSIREFHVDEEKIDYILSVLTSGGKLSGYMAPVRCKDGHVEQMAITSSMRRVDGQLTTSRCFSVCVSSRASATAEDLVSSEENPPAAPATSNSAHEESEKEELAVLFEDFMEFGVTGLHIVDSTGIIRWANRAEMDLLGYTRDEYFGKSVTEVYADGEVLQQLLTTLLSGNKLVRAVTPLWAKDGHTEWVEINSSMRKVNGKCSTTRCFSTCITDRVMREKEEAIAAAKEQEAAMAREETRRKTDFLRKLCHELRNPLAGVTGNIELLLSELHKAEQEIELAVSPAKEPTSTPSLPVSSTQPKQQTTEEKLAQALEKLAETEKRLAETEARASSMQQTISAALGYAESAQLAAEHQMLVVNDTLSLSRLESEGFEFSLKPVDVCNVLDTVQAILGVKAEEKSIDFTISKVDLPDRARYISTDLVWLKQILINLVSNALKFTDPNHGRVDLLVGVCEEEERGHPEHNVNSADEPSTTRQEDSNKVTLQFTVTDNGIGMTEEERGRLFGVFAQANERISSQFGGSGLGLYIVKQLLEHVGGTITVESKKGEGSAFIVKMPCESLTAEARAELIATANQTLRSKGLSHEKYKASSENQNTRVLVVDDSNINRRMLTAFLKKRGYAYESAINGVEALEMHEQSPFDCILTDIDMPLMDGNELTRSIRRKDNADPAQPSVVIIGISGNALPDDITTAKEGGMDEYVSKPFNFQHLESLMVKHLR